MAIAMWKSAMDHSLHLCSPHLARLQNIDHPWGVVQRSKWRCRMKGSATNRTKSEQQPYADHRLHPPEFNHPKPLPKIKPPCHVAPGQTNHDDGDLSLPDETVFDRLERLEPVLTQVAAAYRRQRHGCGHRNPANPDDDSQNMQRASNNDICYRHLLGRNGSASVRSNSTRQRSMGPSSNAFER